MCPPPRWPSSVPWSRSAERCSPAGVAGNRGRRGSGSGHGGSSCGRDRGRRTGRCGRRCRGRRSSRPREGARRRVAGVGGQVGRCSSGRRSWSLAGGGRCAGVAAGGGLPATAPLPTRTGPWQATVEGARESKGQQIATLAVSAPAAGQTRPRGRRRQTDADVFRRGAGRPPAPGRRPDHVVRSRAPARRQRIRGLARGPGHRRHVRADRAGGRRPRRLSGGRLEGFRQARATRSSGSCPEPEGGLAAAILIGLRDRVDRDWPRTSLPPASPHRRHLGLEHSHRGRDRGGAPRLSRRPPATGLRHARGHRGLHALAGATPSVNRAAVMAAVALLAVESGRGSRAMVGWRGPSRRWWSPSRAPSATWGSSFRGGHGRTAGNGRRPLHSPPGGGRALAARSPSRRAWASRWRRRRPRCRSPF